MNLLLSDLSPALCNLLSQFHKSLFWQKVFYKQYNDNWKEVHVPSVLKISNLL